MSTNHELSTIIAAVAERHFDVNYPLFTVSSGTWTSTITKPPLTHQRVLVGHRIGEHRRLRRGQRVDGGRVGGAECLVLGLVLVRVVVVIGGRVAVVVEEQGVRGTLLVAVCARLYGRAINKTDLRPDGGGQKSSNPWHFFLWTPGASVSVTTSNYVECYNRGQKAKHWELDSLIDIFCNEIARYAGWQNYRESTDGWQLSKMLYSDPLRSAPVDVKFIVIKGCTMDIEGNDCSRYLHVAVDSCDCGGVDGKHGGVVRNNCFYWRVDPNVRWL
ncbi:hypothetical protein N658DRAFT_507012 [Parathielavia hyrcaniae]|uniref:Uncharacterized protein n=1 Tax=Parathielavia hyrcaniae TaxID=113614 RepID=A0AAN6T1L2_9PEZI|nr:hypothetical protein N658DRAFT_507012 [Parathielavia hyrcaniae]